MDDTERAVGDGRRWCHSFSRFCRQSGGWSRKGGGDAVSTVKVLTRDKRLVPGGGATEAELAKQITPYGEACPGLEQYATKRFAEAFEAIPRALAENSGRKTSEVLSKLCSAPGGEQTCRVGHR